MLQRFTQWSTAKPMFGTLPQWLPDELDRERIAAYSLYEQIYWTVPEAFKMVQRGTDTQPIFLPNARTIVESTARFLAVDCDWALDPAVGTERQRATAGAMLTTLYKREKLHQKLATQKRYGLIRGDAVWHVVADPSKPLGRRISIYTVDPAAYFPIEDLDQPGHLLGCHLVSSYEDPNTHVTSIRRRTYRKVKQVDGSTRISTELALFETAAWDDRLTTDPAPRLVQMLQPVTLLPPQITSLPVYHVRNQEETEAPFGSSELRGIEGLLAAVNQSISDEDLTLALQGLGLYWTNSGPPVDENGNETNWKLGPGRVVEVEGDSTFGRVSGVTDVSPTQNHISFVLGQAYESIALPDVARGTVDVTIAQSGIALYLQLAPLLAKNKEKENELLPVLDHMHFDLLNAWYPAYEETGDLGVSAGVVVGDPMPRNRAAEISELLSLATSIPPIVSAEYVRTRLASYGYTDLPTNIAEQIAAEQVASTAASDPFAARLGQETHSGNQ